MWRHWDGQGDWGSLTLSNQRFPNIYTTHPPPTKHTNIPDLQLKINTYFESIIIIYFIFIQVQHSTMIIWREIYSLQIRHEVFLIFFSFLQTINVGNLPPCIKASQKDDFFLSLCFCWRNIVQNSQHLRVRKIFICSQRNWKQRKLEKFINHLSGGTSATSCGLTFSVPTKSLSLTNTPPPGQSSPEPSPSDPSLSPHPELLKTTESTNTDLLRWTQTW